jgi:hypothetical protein
MEMTLLEKLREQERHSIRLEKIVDELRYNLDTIKIYGDGKCSDPEIFDNEEFARDIEMISHVCGEVSELLRSKLNFGKEFLLGEDNGEIVEKIHFWTTYRMRIELKKDNIGKCFCIIKPDENTTVDQFRRMVKDYILSVEQMVSAFDSSIQLQKRMEEYLQQYNNTSSPVL